MIIKNRFEQGRYAPVAEVRTNIEIIAANSYQEFSTTVAEEIKKQIKKKPDSNLALPAGNSPRGYYDLLAQSHKEQNWQQIKCFALDDYLGTDEIHTFQHFLESRLYRHINLPAKAKYNPSFYENYDQIIAECGGIDLCLLGLGVNGHIAFNEPPTCSTSWTHCVFLNEETKKANKNDFGQNESAQISLVPDRAVTIGIATILASNRIILAVSGEHKRSVLDKALHGPPNPTLPASYLTTHKDLLVITDFAFKI